MDDPNKNTPAALTTTSVDADFLDKLLNNRLSQQEALAFASSGPELIAFTMLALQQRLASISPQTGPHTPPAAIPPFAKPNSKSSAQAKGKKKRGGQPGHPGKTRDALPPPDRTRNHQLDHCPECKGKLVATGETRSRRSEDIPEDLKPVITEDIIHRDYCPRCQKRFEPRVPDLLPSCTLGNRSLVLSALLHFLQGLTISQIVDTFNFHLRMKVTAGCLVQMWHRLADLLFVWYEQLHQEGLDETKLHADETSWRVSGNTHWLWCFTGPNVVYYLIDRSRGSPALQKFFTRALEGTLITDFWSAYDAVQCADQQKCWPHLLREMSKIEEQLTVELDWKSFSRRVVAVYRDAKKLHSQKGTLASNDYDMGVAKLEGRLLEIAHSPWQHADAQRLAKRIEKYGNQLLTFLWYDDVPMDNNTAERAIRPAVMIRKNSYCNHSDRGALAQSVLMTVFRTLKLRGHQPLDTILNALAEYSRTGSVPPLPAKNASTG
jgi:transposase